MKTIQSILSRIRSSKHLKKITFFYLEVARLVRDVPVASLERFGAVAVDGLEAFDHLLRGTNKRLGIVCIGSIWQSRENRQDFIEMLDHLPISGLGNPESVSVVGLPDFDSAQPLRAMIGYQRELCGKY